MDEKSAITLQEQTANAIGVQKQKKYFFTSPIQSYCKLLHFSDFRLQFFFADFLQVVNDLQHFV